MGGDYRPLGYLPGAFHANMLGMPEYYQQQAQHMSQFGPHGSYMTTEEYDRRVRQMQNMYAPFGPKERVMSVMGECPKDDKKREVWLHKLGEYLNEMDKAVNDAKGAAAAAKRAASMSERKVERIKKKLRLRATQAAKTAILSSFSVIAAFGIWASTWTAGPDFWPVKVFGFCVFTSSVLFCVLAWFDAAGLDNEL